MPGRPITHRRLLVWIYLHGVFLLALSVGASALVARYVISPAITVPARPATKWIATHMASLADKPAVLAAELADLKRRAGVEMTLYRADGQLLGTNASPAPQRMSPRDIERLSDENLRRLSTDGLIAIPIGKSGGVYALVLSPPRDFPWVLVAMQLAVVLLVLALASIPLARSLAAPIEKLAATTRAFGAGDRSVRARSARKDEIGDLARAFDEMAERITELRRSEKELLANVSHELRTPLARIRLAVELVRDGDIQKAGGYLEDIAEDLEELERMLDDVMMTARLDLAQDSGESAIISHTSIVDAKGLLEAAASRFDRRQPGRSLKRHVDDNLGSLKADAPMLRRAIDNLLDNAAKFSDEDQPIELAARRTSPSRLCIEVADHGIGIAEADLTRIFEPFFRSDRSRARATGGIGLGLALARRTVEAHGGSIGVESAAGSGTRFRIELPLSPQSLQ